MMRRLLMLPALSRMEKLLWLGSSALIVIAYVLFDGANVLTLVASLLGAASLILCARGHPLGQLLMIAFSLLYGVISWQARYYGEMITYLGMTMPMAILSLVAWLRHPFQGGRSEVEVRGLPARGVAAMAGLSVLAAAAFYPMLRALHTAPLPWSTLSVATSFLASILTLRRSPLYALAYAANDAVLIVLWSLACAGKQGDVSTIVCFCIFLLNDLYGYLSWRRMQLRQAVARRRSH